VRMTTAPAIAGAAVRRMGTAVVRGMGIGIENERAAWKCEGSADT
jgi:hypothetical protein